MTDLSVIIPARNEEFLQNTIDGVLENIRGDTEIIVVLDGYWPDSGIPQHERLNIIHYEQSIGQRAATNQGARFSQAKFIMKLDAHCMVDEGFDVKLMADCKYDWTVVPAMYNLHAFNWKCKDCGLEFYQSSHPGKCSKCETENFGKKLVWKAKSNPRSEFYYFDCNMKFWYWRAFKKRKEAKGDLAPTLGNLGACFFMHRDRFWDLGGLDEDHGGWGQFGTEVSCKAWLSGGAQMVNKKTWFAHLFRTGSGLGFPYKLSGKAVKRARRYSQNMWHNDNWPLAKHSLSWLIEKFAPVPTWHDNTVPKEGRNQEAIDKIVHKKDIKKVKPKRRPVKGVVYYSNNQIEARIFQIVQKQLKHYFKTGPIVSVTHFPTDFGQNIVVDWPSSVLSMFKQVLLGLETIEADVIYLAEHDVIYHPSHFRFTPPKKDVFYYNHNSWRVRTKDGQAVFYYTKKTSQVCGYKDMFVEHYRNRVKKVEAEGFRRAMGYEPGTHKPPRGFDHFTSDVYESKHPNVDIRHANNLTWSRFKKSQFRRQPKGWQLADEIPHWGKTKGRFEQFIKDIERNLDK